MSAAGCGDPRLGGHRPPLQTPPQPSTPVACPARDAYNEGVKKKSQARAALRKAAEARLPTRYGAFRIVGLEDGRRQWLGAPVEGHRGRAGGPPGRRPP